ncbi:hypothetical protein GQ54DRAFT_224010 [Martensiomyces pterosporus]|nr:hypothetical protein GQ54DRAFT_224010 [Martensiomyces pterosporus]
MVQLLVRSPSVTTPDDFRVVVGLDKSILELKQAIETQHPASPPARSMRVIWKGRMLFDSDMVKRIYEGEGAPEIETVHFVLNMPINAPKASGQDATETAKHPLVAGKEGVSSGDSAEAVADSQGAATTPQADVIPLGNQFQYVLVNGRPYLMELKPLDSRQIGAATAATPAATAASPAHMGPVAGVAGDAPNFELMYARALERQAAVEEMMARLNASISQTAGQPARNGDRDVGGLAAAMNQRAQINNNNANAQAMENAIPLRDLLWSINFSAMWNIAWLLLRVVLLLAVFAHDASWERIFLLAAVVLGFMLLRSQMVQEIIQRLNSNNRYINNNSDNNNNNGDRNGNGNHRANSDSGAAAVEQEHQMFSVWDKVKALVIALVTSLVPSEPFQVPAVEE